MSALMKLYEATLILEEELTLHINILKFEPKLARIFIKLCDNIQIYIRYNNHNQYSYTIISSKFE